LLRPLCIGRLLLLAAFGRIDWLFGILLLVLLLRQLDGLRLLWQRRLDSWVAGKLLLLRRRCTVSLGIAERRPFLIGWRMGGQRRGGGSLVGAGARRPVPLHVGRRAAQVHKERISVHL
jgi:hypothetical protein